MIKIIAMLLVAALIAAMFYIGALDKAEEHQDWADPEAERLL